METSTDRDAHDKLWKMIKGCRFAMLTTVDENHELRGRPMTTLQKEFDGVFWYLSPIESDVVRSIEANGSVALAFSKSSDADFVSVSGQASIENDPNKKRELWNPLVQAWFPEGPESTDVTLIRVHANHADYWDSRANKLTQLFSFAKALATKTKPNVGEHKSLRF